MFTVHIKYVPADDTKFKKAAYGAVRGNAEDSWNEAAGVAAVTNALIGDYPNVYVQAEGPANVREFAANDVRWTIYRDGRP
jgi:hypothetical protein